MISLTLPFPPSVNAAYRAVRNPKTGGVRNVKSRALREFEREAGKAATAAGAKRGSVPEGAALSLTLLMFVPDRRKRDIDNLCKASIDALKHALGFDDSRVAELHVYKRTDKGFPRCEAVLRWQTKEGS